VAAGAAAGTGSSSFAATGGSGGFQMTAAASEPQGHSG